MNTTLSLANTTDDARFDSEADEIVRRLFSPDDFALTPEEYAARHAHEWGLFSFHRFRYRDPNLGAWIRRLGEIIEDDTQVEKYKQQFLTPKEIAEIEVESADPY